MSPRGVIALAMAYLSRASIRDKRITEGSLQQRSNDYDKLSLQTAPILLKTTSWDVAIRQIGSVGSKIYY
jgi:hypothetical protein